MSQGTGLNKDHLTGLVVGVGIAATGYYLYIRNKEKVDQMLANYGINMPESVQKDYSKMSLEELMLKKETIEDLIAEKEMEISEAVSSSDLVEE